MSDWISCCWKGQCFFLLSLPSGCWGFAAALESSISLSLWWDSTGCAGSACPSQLLAGGFCSWVQHKVGKGWLGETKEVGLWPSVVFPRENSASCSRAFHQHSAFQQLCFVSFDSGCLLCWRKVVCCVNTVGQAQSQHLLCDFWDSFKPNLPAVGVMFVRSGLWPDRCFSHSLDAQVCPWGCVGLFIQWLPAPFVTPWHAWCHSFAVVSEELAVTDTSNLHKQCALSTLNNLELPGRWITGVKISFTGYPPCELHSVASDYAYSVFALWSWK